MAGPYPAYGTIFKASSTSTLATVGGVKSIDGPQFARDSIDVTSLTDTHKKKIVARPNSGTVTLEVLADDTNLDLFEGQVSGDITTANVPSALYFGIVFPHGDTYTFQGYVTAFSLKSNGDEALVASITIEITGAVTVAATT